MLHSQILELSRRINRCTCRSCRLTLNLSFNQGSRQSKTRQSDVTIIWSHLGLHNIILFQLSILKVLHFLTTLREQSLSLDVNDMEKSHMQQPDTEGGHSSEENTRGEFVSLDATPKGRWERWVAVLPKEIWSNDNIWWSSSGCHHTTTLLTEFSDRGLSLLGKSLSIFSFRWAVYDIQRFRDRVLILKVVLDFSVMDMYVHRTCGQRLC